MSFLFLARHQRSLIYRIAFFMPIYESLFSNNSFDISYKVSHRLAFYIGKDSTERLEISKTFRALYNIRSRFIHGDRLNPEPPESLEGERKGRKKGGKNKRPITHDMLLEHSRYIDELTRVVLTKVIKEDARIFLRGQTGTEQFYEELIFPPVNQDYKEEDDEESDEVNDEQY